MLLSSGGHVEEASETPTVPSTLKSGLPDLSPLVKGAHDSPRSSVVTLVSESQSLLSEIYQHDKVASVGSTNPTTPTLGSRLEVEEAHPKPRPAHPTPHKRKIDRDPHSKLTSLTPNNHHHLHNNPQINHLPTPPTLTRPLNNQYYTPLRASKRVSNTAPFKPNPFIKEREDIRLVNKRWDEMMKQTSQAESNKIVLQPLEHRKSQSELDGSAAAGAGSGTLSLNGSQEALPVIKPKQRSISFSETVMCRCISVASLEQGSGSNASVNVVDRSGDDEESPEQSLDTLEVNDSLEPLSNGREKEDEEDEERRSNDDNDTLCSDEEDEDDDKSTDTALSDDTVEIFNSWPEPEPDSFPQQPPRAVRDSITLRAKNNPSSGGGPSPYLRRDPVVSISPPTLGIQSTSAPLHRFRRTLHSPQSFSTTVGSPMMQKRSISSAPSTGSSNGSASSLSELLPSGAIKPQSPITSISGGGLDLLDDEEQEILRRLGGTAVVIQPEEVVAVKDAAAHESAPINEVEVQMPLPPKIITRRVSFNNEDVVIHPITDDAAPMANAKGKAKSFTSTPVEEFSQSPSPKAKSINSAGSGKNVSPTMNPTLSASLAHAKSWMIHQGKITEARAKAETPEPESFSTTLLPSKVVGHAEALTTTDIEDDEDHHHTTVTVKPELVAIEQWVKTVPNEVEVPHCKASSKSNSIASKQSSTVSIKVDAVEGSSRKKSSNGKGKGPAVPPKDLDVHNVLKSDTMESNTTVVCPPTPPPPSRASTASIESTRRPTTANEPSADDSLFSHAMDFLGTSNTEKSSRRTPFAPETRSKGNASKPYALSVMTMNSDNSHESSESDSDSQRRVDSALTFSLPTPKYGASSSVPNSAAAARRQPANFVSQKSKQKLLASKKLQGSGVEEQDIITIEDDADSSLGLQYHQTFLDYVGIDKSESLSRSVLRNSTSSVAAVFTRTPPRVSSDLHLPALFTGQNFVVASSSTSGTNPHPLNPELSMTNNSFMATAKGALNTTTTPSGDTMMEGSYVSSKWGEWKATAKKWVQRLKFVSSTSVEPFRNSNEAEIMPLPSQSEGSRHLLSAQWKNPLRRVAVADN